MFESEDNPYPMEGEEEDEVIRELDVYVNNDLLLYLAQFPLKPVYAEPVDVQSARYKPNHHKIELSTPYPQSIQNILAKEKALSSSSSSAYNRSSTPEVFTQKLISSEIEQSNPLMIGFIQNNQLFLSNVDRVLQFHPVMNSQHANIKVELLENDVDYDTAPVDDESGAPSGGGNSSSGGGGENVKQIQLKRKESERAQNARLQSYSYLKQQEEAEPWINLKPFPIGSQVSDAKFSVISGDVAAQR